MSYYTSVTLAGTSFELGKVPLKVVAEAVAACTVADLDQLRCTFTWAKGRVAQLEQKKLDGVKVKFLSGKTKVAKGLLAAITAKGQSLNGDQPKAAPVEAAPKVEAATVNFEDKVSQYVDLGMNKLAGLVNSGVTKNPVLIEAQAEAMSYFVDTAPIQVTKLNDAEQSFARLIDAAVSMGIDINKVLATR